MKEHQQYVCKKLSDAGIDSIKTKLYFTLQNRREEDERLMPRYKYSDKDVAKLDRYRVILVGMLEKYWDTRNPIYKHQESRIWRMIHKEFPNIVILDGHYND